MRRGSKRTTQVSTRIDWPWVTGLRKRALASALGRPSQPNSFAVLRQLQPISFISACTASSNQR
jgi:hypothetical protein